MKPRVFVTRAVPEPVREALQSCFDPRWPRTDAGPIAPADLLAAAQNCDALVTMLTDSVDEAVLAAGPRMVANYAAGTNNIDLVAARRLGVTVTNTPGVLTNATADLAFGLLLATARHIIEGDKLVRDHAWTGWGPQLMLGSELSGHTLGIIGFGRIGQAMARRAKGFGLTVVYAARRDADPALSRELGARRMELGEFLACSDFVSVHCPLTPETRLLLDSSAFSRMRPGAILINTARGEVVDEAAMLDALESGRLGGAGLDVFTGEPAINPRLLAAKNVVAAPHLGSATGETRLRMGMMVVKNLQEFFAGNTPPNRVD
ncbi:MAG: D-glycerate dehydrogenase [Nitrospirota bacterium]|nr:D-glycerate dehydrogenase [Nitrospirota bacterium]